MRMTMLGKITESITSIFEAPYQLLYLLVLVCFSYCAALILIGFPCSIWESITKKKVNEDIEKKVITVATVIIVIAVIIWDANQK